MVFSDLTYVFLNAKFKTYFALHLMPSDFCSTFVGSASEAEELSSVCKIADFPFPFAKRP